jgi:hypothetical protein
LAANSLQEIGKEPMTPDLRKIVAELVLLLHELKCESHAIMQILVDKKILSEEELQTRLGDVKREEQFEAQVEARRRDLESAWESIPKQ